MRLFPPGAVVSEAGGLQLLLGAARNGAAPRLPASWALMLFLKYVGRIRETFSFLFPLLLGTGGIPESLSDLELLVLVPRLGMPEPMWPICSVLRCRRCMPWTAGTRLVLRCSGRTCA